jgi:mRNA export factor
MAFFNSSASNTLNAASSNTDAKDIEMGDPPTDSISSLAFSGQADYLAVGSWDNSVRQQPHPISPCFLTRSLRQVRIYEVGAGGQSQGKAMYQHEGPVLSVCWNKVASISSLLARLLMWQ